MNRTRLAAIALLVITVGMVPLAWGLGISPMLAQAREAEQYDLITKGELALANQTIEDLKSATEQIGAQFAELELLRKRLPAEPETDRLAARIASLADRNAVSIQSLSFADPVGVTGEGIDETLEGRMFRLDVTARVAGPMDGVLAFLEAIQTDNRVTVINTIRMSPGEVVILEFSGAALVIGPTALPGVVPSDPVTDAATPDGS